MIGAVRPRSVLQQVANTPTLIRTGSSSASYAARTTLELNAETARVAGDAGLVGCWIEGTTVTLTTPEGWTLLGTAKESTANLKLWWFGRRYDGTSKDNFKTTLSVSSGCLGEHYRIVGNPSAPSRWIVGTESSGNSTKVKANAITAKMLGSLFVMCWDVQSAATITETSSGWSTSYAQAGATYKTSGTWESSGTPEVTISSAIVWTALPIAIPPSTSVLLENLVIQPNFEGASTEWHSRGAGSTVELQTTTVHDGTKALKVVLNGTEENAGAESSDSIFCPALIGGSTVTYSTWVWAPTGTTVSPIMQEHDAAGNFVANQFPSGIVGNNGWQRSSMTFKLASNTARLQPIFYVGGKVSTTFYIDSMMVEYGSTLNSYFDGAVAPTNYETYWTGTANQSISRAFYTVPASEYSKGVAETLRNVVSPGDFENGTESWFTVGSSISQSSEQAHSGTKSLKVVTAGSGSFNGAEREFTSAPGRSYKLVIWIKGEATRKNRIYWQNGSEEGFVEGVKSSEWQELTVEGKTNATTGSLQFGVRVTESAATTIYVDDVLAIPVVQDSIARIAGHPRSNSETLSTSETPARLAAFNRAVEDKLTGSAKEPELFDTFNRAEGFVNAGEGSTLWSSEGINAATNNLKVIGNALGVAANSLNGTTKNKYGPNVEGWAELTELMGTSEGYVFFSTRQAQNYAEIAGTWNGYGFIFIRTGASTYVHQIRKYTSGSNVGTLASSTKALALNDQIGFSAIGSTLKLLRKPSGESWETLAEITDSTYNTAGYVGIEMTTTTRLDNMWLGTVEAGAGIKDIPTFETGHAGGSTYSSEVAETLSPSQTVTRSTTVTRTPSESLSTSDSPSRFSAISRAVADYLGIVTYPEEGGYPEEGSTPLSGASDSVSVVKLFARTISDTLSTSDAISRAVSNSRTVSQTQSTTDSPSRLLVVARAVADALSTSDAVKRVFTGARNIPDNLTTSDQPFTGSIKERSVTETLTTSDAITRSTAVNRARSETLTTSDAVSRSTAAKRTTSEALSTSESPSRATAVVRAITQTLTTSDAVTRVPGLARAVTEALSTSDSVKRVFVGARAIADTLSTSDSPTRTGSVTRKVTESIALSETVARVFNGTRKTTESLSTSDSVSAQKSIFKNVSETLATSDSPARSVGHFTRAVLTSIPLSDVVTRVYNGFREIIEQVNTNDHPHAKIVTIYHGEKIVELHFDEAQYFVSGEEALELVRVPGESIVWEEGENQLRINIFKEQLTVNQPDPTLRVQQRNVTKYDDTAYDDKLKLDLSTSTSNSVRSNE